MTCAEHLVENVIFAMKNGRDPYEEIAEEYNRMQLAYCSISADDIISIACHVVYCLYDGQFPKFCEQ